MNENNIDVSIIITSYNYENYIEQAIKSCFSQNSSNLKYEVIIVDDGSTDNSKFYIQNLNNCLLKKFFIRNSGIEFASNYGFKKSKGKYVVRLDADDYLEKNYLSSISKFINEDFDFFYSNYFVIDENSKVLNKIDLPPFSLEEVKGRGDFLASGTIYRKNKIRELGYYNQKFKNCGLENYELILKLILSGFKGLHIPKHLFNYRIHGENLSNKRKEDIIRYGRNLFSRFDLGDYKTNQNHPYKLNLD